MLAFDDLFSRADESVLKHLLVPSAARLIAMLDSKYATPSRLRPLIIDFHSRAGLLLTTAYRCLLLDLLRPDEAKLLAELLGLSNSEDIYCQLKSISFKIGSEKTARLFGFFELVAPESVVDETVPSVTAIEPVYSLFKHQRYAASQVHNALATPPHRVLLHMPTGAGKTRTAMNVIAEHLRAREPGLVLWLAYSEELCEQAVQEFAAAWRVLGNRNVSVYRYWGSHTLNMNEARDGVIVCGLPKLVAASKHDIAFIGTLAGRASLLIIDEAHQAIAPTYRMILDALFHLGGPSSLLGLTATPGRTWADIDADAQLSAFFGKRKVMLEVEGYPNPVDYLIQEGYLAAPQFRSLLHTSGKSLSPADECKVGEAFDIPQAVLDKLAEDEIRNLVILTEAGRLLKIHKRVLLFAASVRHSDLLAAVLKAQGYAAVSVTGKTPPTERARILEEYKQRDDIPRMVCNFGILTTGFDAPQTSAVLIARPTKSLILYSQMVGRAIRGTRAGGNAEAEIVTMTDTNLPGFGAIAQAFTNWEDVWRNP